MEYKFIETHNIYGEKIRGVYNYYKAYENDKIPVIIIYHGFTGNRYGSTFLYREFAKYITELGYGVYRFDFIGSGDSDGDFKDMTLSSEVEDAITIYDYVKEQKNVDDNNIFFLGHSMGGFVSTIVAEKLNPRGLILLCPAIEMYELANEYYENLENKDIRSVNVGGLEVKLSFLNDLRKYNGYKSASNYTGPVLMFRGTEDRYITKESFKELKDSFKGFVINIEIQNTGHSFENFYIRENIFASIEDFLDNEKIQ